MPTMTEFSVRPTATVTVDGDAADLLNAIGDALEHDARAIGPVVAYNYERHQVDAIFQVDVPDVDAGDPRTEAVTLTLDIFDSALRTAGIGSRTGGYAIVEGDDPDQLP